MKKAGILGGTFDPIHKGHIALAENSLKKFGLDYIIFVPTGMPPHKNKRPLASKKHRLKMVEEIVKTNPKFKLYKGEINRPGYSYAVDTFSRLKKRFGKSTKLYYIMGLDSINSILNWKKPLELFKLCEFIVATRPNAKIKTFKRLIKFPPINANKEKIHLFEMHVHISSTEIRNRIKLGKKISKFVPKPVENYIKKFSLYKTAKERK